MEHELKHLTHWLNHVLGPLALQLLHSLGIQPADYDQPIPEYVVMSLVVLILGTILALILRSQLSVQSPRLFQQAAEGLLTNSMGFGIKDLIDENVSHGGERYIPFLGTISVFVLLSNLLSIFPEFSSPTVSPIVPLACTSLVFIYFNWQGIRHHGLGGYLLSFAGFPKKLGDWLLAVLLFPVEIISTLARILSLTVRLWANIFASDLIYIIFLGLMLGPFQWAWSKSPILGVLVGVFPVAIPVLFVGLHIFVSVIQAYIFTVLPAIYVGLAVADDH
jgi:F-type H+-transporting ATPase subunit a